MLKYDWAFRERRQKNCCSPCHDLMWAWPQMGNKSVEMGEIMCVSLHLSLNLNVLNSHQRHMHHAAWRGQTHTSLSACCMERTDTCITICMLHGEETHASLSVCCMERIDTSFTTYMLHGEDRHRHHYPHAVWRTDTCITICMLYGEDRHMHHYLHAAWRGHTFTTICMLHGEDRQFLSIACRLATYDCDCLYDLLKENEL